MAIQSSQAAGSTTASITFFEARYETARIGLASYQRSGCSDQENAFIIENKRSWSSWSARLKGLGTKKLSLSSSKLGIAHDEAAGRLAPRQLTVEGHAKHIRRKLQRPRFDVDHIG